MNKFLSFGYTYLSIYFLLLNYVTSYWEGLAMLDDLYTKNGIPFEGGAWLTQFSVSGIKIMQKSINS